MKVGSRVLYACELENREAAVTSAHSCPLCGGKLAVASKPYAASDVLALWERSGRRFPHEVSASFAGYEPTVLYRCSQCGVGLFRPTWAASRAFYDALQASSDTYYLQEKWEYGWAIPKVRPGDAVLDVGCGAGRFLELVRSRGAKGVGIETAPSARAQAISRGFDVYDVNVAEDSATVGRDFDVVCAFQVLEHVPDPVAFAEALVACTRAGGTIVVAVPNAEGSLRWLGDQCSDLPPHHLSRWSACALKAPARRLGLSVVDLVYEPLDIVHHRDHLVGWWRNAVLGGRGAEDQWHTPVGFVRRVGSSSLHNAQTLAGRAGCSTVPWIRGHTVAAILRKLP